MELEMLKTIIEKTLGRNMDAITEKTTFVDDLGVDSLDFFQILIDLEETFDVRIPAVPATRRVHVGGDRRNVLDDSGVFPCLELEIIPFGVALVAHLVYYLVLFCRFHHQFDLVERACHRLLGSPAHGAPGRRRWRQLIRLR